MKDLEAGQGDGGESSAGRDGRPKIRVELCVLRNHAFLSGYSKPRPAGHPFVLAYYPIPSHADSVSAWEGIG